MSEKIIDLDLAMNENDIFQRKRAVVSIMRPTNNCNMDCRYCYVRKSNSPVGFDDIASIIEKIVLFNGKNKVSRFIWHGGEPLLAGLDFYKEVIAIQKKLKQRGFEIQNSVQTNGTLLSLSTFKYLEIENDFNLSLSIDGPRKLHNAARTFKDGSGSFDAVMNAVEIMRSNNKKPSCICVVSKINVSESKKLYNFFNKERIHVKFNPIIRKGKGETNYREIGISQKEYSSLMIKIFDLWFNDLNQHILIDPLSTIMGNMLTGFVRGCNFSTCQKQFITVNFDGNVYPCNRFIGDEFYLGNIYCSSLEDIFNSKKKEELNNIRLNIIQKFCLECPFVKICNSGCLAESYYSSEWQQRPPFCLSNKILFSYILSCIENEVLRCERLSVGESEGLINIMGHNICLKFLKPALRREIESRIKHYYFQSNQSINFLTVDYECYGDQPWIDWKDWPDYTDGNYDDAGNYDGA
jgi:uncharacterized protein